MNARAIARAIHSLTPELPDGSIRTEALNLRASLSELFFDRNRRIGLTRMQKSIRNAPYTV
jgi:hypothetical protein